MTNRLELFVDDWLVGDVQDGVCLQLQIPVRREVVLALDAPWENELGGYYHVFRDRDRIRLYYRGLLDRETGDTGAYQTTALAESDDGICFSKPELGLVEFDGSSANNIVHMGVEAHNFFVFRDDNPSAPDDARYKAVGGGWKNLYAFVSPDGIQWHRLQEDPLDVAGTFDSLNVVFWDRLEGCYRLFSRTFLDWQDPAREGRCRCIQSSRSDDFVHWSEPVLHNYGPDAEEEQYYTNATIPCPGAEHILLSFPKRFVPERTKVQTHTHPGVSDAVFMSSRDGVHWHRFREAWVRPGLDWRNWTERNNMPAHGIVETGPHEWSMYLAEHTRHPTSRLRRLTVRPWGFASMHAGYSGGEFVTRPLRLTCDRLSVNYSTSAVGSLEAEIQTESGEAVAGFAFADMSPMFGDELDADLTWNGDCELRNLGEQIVRLRFRLKDADLFALRFG